MSIWKRLTRDERGATMIMVAVMITVSIGFAVIAIDLGKVMLAKTQLQNAADAAALSGATIYAMTNWDQNEARTAAKYVAGLNMAVESTLTSVVISDDDISFDNPREMKVTTHRTGATGDPVRVYFRRVLSDVSNTGDVTATATASVYPVAAPNCVKPWCFPDQWDDADGDGVYDAPEEYTDLDSSGSYDLGEPFDDADKDGVWDEGEFYDPDLTGYRVPESVGDTVVLKIGDYNGDFRTGWAYCVCYPPVPDAITSEYWENIVGCDTNYIAIGDILQIFPGQNTGPTRDGLEYLISLDPEAYWDGTQVVSEHGVSPRIVFAPVFDPRVGTEEYEFGGGAEKYVTITNIVSIFLLGSTDPKAVTGIFIPRPAGGEICPECPDGFAYRAVLTE